MSKPYVDYMLSCNVTSYMFRSLNLILHKQLYRMASTKKIVWYVWTAIKLSEVTLSKVCPPATLWHYSDAEEQGPACA